jgi:CheY-like chemotaxis protein
VRRPDRAAGAACRRTRNARRAQVLIVEDNALNLELLATVLEGANFDVVTARMPTVVSNWPEL